MKYYTRQSYIEFQAQNLMKQLKPDENAAVFSEEYFNETYAAEEKLFRQDRQKFIDVLEKQPFLPCPSDEESGKQIFRRNYEHNLRMFDEHLTDDIKEKVADMRLLALDRATPEVVSAAKKLADELYVHIRLQDHNYKLVFRKNFPFSSSNILSDISLHDSTVTAIEISSNDLYISVKTSSLVSQHKQLRFKNADILHCEGDITGCTWLYTEIYPCKTGYEVHVLLLRDVKDAYIGDMLMELTLTCSTVHIKDLKNEPEHIKEAD